MSLLAGSPLLAALLGAIATATVLAALCLGALALAGNSRAAVRECLAFAAVLAMSLAPCVHLAGHRLDFGVALLPAAPAAIATDTAQPQAQQQVEAQTLALPPDRTAPDGAGTDPAATAAAAPAPAATTGTPSPPMDAGALLLLAWLAFAAVRLGLDLARGHRLARRVRALPAADAALQRLLADAAAALGLRRAPPLHVGANVVCPATIGVLRPRLVAPSDLLPRHGRAAAAAMLRHECAHLACGHHRQGLAVLLLRALFGWHPLAHALLRALATAQEDTADNAAAAHGSAPAYARSLLALAERAGALQVTPLQLSALGRSPLAARVHRLLAEETDPMLHPHPRVRALTTLATALLLCTTAAVRLAPAQTRGQDPAPGKAHPESTAAYLPLQPGAAWTWKLARTHDGTTTTLEEVAWDFGEVPAPPGRCHQLLVTQSDGDYVSPEYWSADETGIYEHDHRYTAGIRGPGSGRTRLVPGPVGVETRWTWTYQLSYQTHGDVERDPEQDKVSCVGELIAIAEPVAVPAGRFTAAHVKITSTCAHWQGESIRELWFARGTGLVKEVSQGIGGNHVRELVAHAPAPAAAADDGTALPTRLQADPRARDGAPATTWLDLDEAACYLRGRFALVTFAGGTEPVRAAFYCHGSEVAEIAADDVAFWSQRWQEAQRGPAVRARLDPKQPQPQLWRDAPGASMELTFLAQTFGAVEAHRLGCTGLESIGSNTTTQLDSGASTHTSLWHCRDAAGTERDLAATFAVSSNTIATASAKLEASTRGKAGQRKTLPAGVPPPPVPLPHGR